MRTSQRNIEKSLSRLLSLIGFELKRGWKKQLSEWFDVPISLLSNWINRNALPKERIKYAEARGYPREKWYVEEEVTETFDLSDHAEVEVDRGPEWCHQALDKIFASKEKSTIRAIKANIEEFLEKVEEKKRQDRKIANLEDQIAMLLKNGGETDAAHPEDAGDAAAHDRAPTAGKTKTTDF